MDGVQGSQYGMRVLGMDAYMRDQQVSHARGSLYGSALTGSQYGEALTAGTPPAQVRKDGPYDGRVLLGIAVETMADLLESQPSLFPDAVEAELGRPDGPRVEGLHLLIACAKRLRKPETLITALEELLPPPPKAPAKAPAKPAPEGA